MPHNLVIVLAPKFAYINDKNEVSVRRPVVLNVVAQQLKPAALVNSDGIPQDETLIAPAKSVAMVTSSPSISGGALSEDDSRVALTSAAAVSLDGIEPPIPPPNDRLVNLRLTGVAESMSKVLPPPDNGDHVSLEAPGIGIDQQPHQPKVASHVRRIESENGRPAAPEEKQREDHHGRNDHLLILQRSASEEVPPISMLPQTLAVSPPLQKQTLDLSDNISVDGPTSSEPTLDPAPADGGAASIASSGSNVSHLIKFGEVTSYEDSKLASLSGTAVAVAGRDRSNSLVSVESLQSFAVPMDSVVDNVPESEVTTSVVSAGYERTKSVGIAELPQNKDLSQHPAASDDISHHSSEQSVGSARGHAIAPGIIPIPSAMTTGSSGNKIELMRLTGDAVDEDITELTEVNIRGFLMTEMDAMFQESIICARPTLVDDETGNSIQAMCICERESIDEVIARFAYYGVGNLLGSINVVALESSKFYRPPQTVPEAPPTRSLQQSEDTGLSTATDSILAGSVDPLVAEPADTKGPAVTDLLEGGTNTNASSSVAAAAIADQQRKRKQLISDIASELRVEQVIEQIEDAATMDFDYIMLLLIASIIAGIGLATDNTVVIVASMLVSPIMGPVLALTFGSIIHNMPLTMLGLFSELISLLICIGIGFIIGVVAIFVGTEQLWPTDEMRSRGVVENLAIGLAIAVPSGMGVALSVLGNNTSSLVGVAISASLLPPAVNCGMAFAYAAFGFNVDTGAIDSGDFDDAHSFFILGIVSLALTIVNIGAIYLSGYITFRIKEVAPIRNKQAFWERDTQAFRRLRQQQQQNEHGPSSSTLAAHQTISSIFGSNFANNQATTQQHDMGQLGHENSHECGDSTPSAHDIDGRNQKEVSLREQVLSLPREVRFELKQSLGYHPQVGRGMAPLTVMLPTKDGALNRRCSRKLHGSAIGEQGDNSPHVLGGFGLLELFRGESDIHGDGKVVDERAASSPLTDGNSPRVHNRVQFDDTEGHKVHGVRGGDSKDYIQMQTFAASDTNVLRRQPYRGVDDSTSMSDIRNRLRSSGKPVRARRQATYWR